MSLTLNQIDRAILDLYHRKVRFTHRDLRAQLGLPTGGPETKRLANRMYQLHRRMKVLKTDGISKRNMAYTVAEGKLRGLEERFGGTMLGASSSAPNDSPIRKLARLAELNELKTTVLEMAARLERVEKLVAEVHAGLFAGGSE